MKYFGQYLVDKGVITETALIEALVEQTSSLPTVMEIIHKLKLLNPADFLKVVSEQYAKKIEFKSACIELRLWNDSMEKAVRTELESRRMPLGQVLVKRGAADLAKITRALDEFLSEFEATVQPVVSKPAEAKTVVTEKGPEPAAAAPAAERLIDANLLEEFSHFLTDAKIEEFAQTMAKTTDENPETALTNLKETVVQVHTLRGLVRCLQLQESEKIFADIEKKGLSALEGLKKNERAKAEMLGGLNKNYGDFLRTYRTALLSSRSESQCLGDNAPADIQVFLFELNRI